MSEGTIQNRTNAINLAHEVEDIRGKVVTFGVGGAKLTIRAALVESLSVQVQGLAEQVRRADLAKKILLHKEDMLPVSGPARAMLGEAVGAYPWHSIIVPDLLEQIDPQRLVELRAEQ